MRRRLALITLFSVATTLSCRDADPAAPSSRETPDAATETPAMFADGGATEGDATPREAGSPSDVAIVDASTPTDAVVADVAVFDTLVSDVAAPDVTPPDTPTSGCAPAPHGWRPMAALSSEPPPYGGSFNANATTAAWSGKEMIVLGTIETSVKIAAYDPATDKWRSLPAPPLDESVRGVPAGTHYLAFGGTFRSGKNLDLVTGTSVDIATLPISPRHFPAVTYAPSTHEVVIWGGVTDDGEPLTDGGAYDVVANKWRMIAAAPLAKRKFASAVWTGARVLVAFGCFDDYTAESCAAYGDAAAYDPDTDVWTKLSDPPIAKRARYMIDLTIGSGAATKGAIWQGIAAFPMKPSTAPTAYYDGVMFDEATKSWLAIPDPKLPGERRLMEARWVGDGGKMYVWGGNGMKDGKLVLFDDGASFDPAKGSWTPMPTGGPSGRQSALAVWTGCDAIVFGGGTDAGWVTTGMLYRP